MGRATRGESPVGSLVNHRDICGSATKERLFPLEAVRPRPGALTCKHLLGDRDLLLGRCLPGIASVLTPAVAEPGVRVELQSPVVSRVDVPVPTALALRDRVPVGL